MNIYTLFAQASGNAPNAPALIDGIGKHRRALSFAELNCQVESVTIALRKSGLRAGDRVLLAVPISIDTYVVMLALLKGGMVIMHIDPGHGATTIARILRDWPPNAIVASRPILMLGSLFPELRRIPRRFVVGGRMRGAVRLCHGPEAGQTLPITDRSAADPAILSFTSGSTGQPKALLRTHGFLREQMQILNRIALTAAHDIDFVAMPMFVLFNLANRVSSVLPACNMKHPERADPRIVLSQLCSEGATRMVASPALLERLADYCLLKKRQIPGMRCISTGGGPVGPGLAQRLRVIAPDATVKAVYGSTEAEPIASIDGHQVSIADRLKTRQGGGLLVGKPVRGCAVRVIHSRPGQVLGPFTAEAFSNQCLPPADVGEIIVSGEHVLQGYADSSRDRETKIHVHSTVWHRTGDAGYFDSSGRLWLVGRCAAALQDYRGSVYPFQVEYAVSAVRGVRRSALVEKDGDRILVLETSSREFRSNCAEAAKCIAHFEIDRIVTLPRIPVDRRHGAKVDYTALSRMLEGRFPRWRNYLAERLSLAFIGCRDAWNRLRSQAHVYAGHRR